MADCTRHLFILVLATLFSCSALAYEVGDWAVLQLTDNETIDINPRVEGQTVLRSGMGDTGQWQVFMWSDGVTTMLSPKSREIQWFGLPMTATTMKYSLPTKPTLGLPQSLMSAP